MTNEEFVRVVYEASYRRLVPQLVGCCGDVPTAEEVVQEAFVSAIAHAATRSHADNPEAWLRQVAVNLARGRWRRLKKYAGLMPRLAEPATAPDLSPDHVTLMTVSPPMGRSARVLDAGGAVDHPDLRGCALPVPPGQCGWRTAPCRWRRAEGYEEIAVASRCSLPADTSIL